MKNSILSIVTVFATAAGVAGCSSSPSQLQKTIEDHPEIVFSAIEKHPDQFMEVVQKASRAGQAKAQENAEKEEKARMDAELKNPLQPALPEDRAYRGATTAPVMVVEYSDFQCPFCKRGFNTVEEVRQKYGDKIRFLYKNLPLPMHPMAIPAAKHFEAIALQSAEKAYKFHDEVFKNQDKLSSDGEKFLDATAKKVGANMAKMKADMEGETVKARMAADQEEAKKFGIEGTPGFVVAGVSIKGAYPLQTFSEIIDKKLAAPATK